MWLWPVVPTAGALMWGTALIALLPGNFISAILIEKLFWSSGLSLTGMSLLETPIMVAVNALLWFLLVRLVQRLRGHPDVPSTGR
jgi:hypothetical protein